VIGQLPRYRPRALRRPTLAYTRLRRRSQRRANKQANVSPAVNNEIVLFDHGPTEFPVATARPHDARARAIALVSDLKNWLAARWQWLKPRTVPCAVAGLGMMAVLASADYLAHQHGEAQTMNCGVPGVTPMAATGVVIELNPR
jgi:hypothetical protein